MQETYVIVQFQVEYFHRWTSAPPEHEYLSALHRHMLHIKAVLQVFHNDREIEIIDLKAKLQAAFQRMLKSQPDELAPVTDRDFHTARQMIANAEASCEAIAYALGRWLQFCYGTERVCAVTVLEDGENGAHWAFRPNPWMLEEVDAFEEIFQTPFREMDNTWTKARDVTDAA